MAAGDNNMTWVGVSVLHSPDPESTQVAQASRTRGIHYEPAKFDLGVHGFVGKKLHEYSNAGATAGTTTTTSTLTSVAKGVVVNRGLYSVEVEWWQQIGQAAAGNIVITAGAGALATIGHTTTDMDASPQYADAGDYVHLSSTAEDAGNQDTYHLIASVAASAGTTQIALAGIATVTANADDDTVVLTFLRKNKVVLEPGDQLMLGPLWVAKNIIITGRTGASECLVALLEV